MRDGERGSKDQELGGRACCRLANPVGQPDEQLFAPLAGVGHDPEWHARNERLPPDCSSHVAEVDDGGFEVVRFGDRDRDNPDLRFGEE